MFSGNDVTANLLGTRGKKTVAFYCLEHLPHPGPIALIAAADFGGWRNPAAFDAPLRRKLFLLQIYLIDAEQGFDDAAAAFDWLVARGHKRIVIHGESLGTAVAAELATRRPAVGLVLEAPFTSARAVANRVLPVVGGLVMWGYNTKAKIDNVTVPVLVIHGDRDEIIDYELGVEVFKAAREPRTMWTVSGAHHNDLHQVADSEFPSRLRAFYVTLR